MNAAIDYLLCYRDRYEDRDCHQSANNRGANSGSMPSTQQCKRHAH